MARQLNNPAVPALPVSPETYNRPWNASLLNVLRLYFNQLKALLDNFVSLADQFQNGDYGHTIKFPHGAFQSNVTQTVSAAATPTRIALDTTDYAYEMYFVAGDGIHFDVAGRYNIQFSCQITNTQVQAHDIDIWLRKNGSTSAYDIPNTASVQTVPSTHGGQPGYQVIAANFYIQVDVGDFIGLWWAASSTSVQLNHLPAITTPFTSPAAPSVVVTATFVSAIP